MIQLVHRMPAAAPIRQRITRTIELPNRCRRGGCAVPAGSASPAGTAARAPHPPSWATSWATHRVHRRLHRRSSTPPPSARYPLRRPPARPRRPRPAALRPTDRRCRPASSRRDSRDPGLEIVVGGDPRDLAVVDLEELAGGHRIALAVRFGQARGGRQIFAMDSVFGGRAASKCALPLPVCKITH